MFEKEEEQLGAVGLFIHPFIYFLLFPSPFSFHPCLSVKAVTDGDPHFPTLEIYIFVELKS